MRKRKIRFETTLSNNGRRYELLVYGVFYPNLPECADGPAEPAEFDATKILVIKDFDGDQTMVGKDVLPIWDLSEDEQIALNIAAEDYLRGSEEI